MTDDMLILMGLILGLVVGILYFLDWICEHTPEEKE